MRRVERKRVERMERFTRWFNLISGVCSILGLIVSVISWLTG